MKMSWMSITLSLALLLQTVNVNAIVIRHDIDDKQYQTDTYAFPPLATLYAVGAHGTLIAPQWVVTAAHTIFCVERGDIIKVGNQFAEVEARYAHHLYERGQEHDIAMIKLRSPVEGITPATPYGSDDEAGQQIWFIGGGGTGNGKVGQTVSYKQNKGQLRLAQNTIRAVDEGEIYFTFNQGSDALPLEGVSGNGDSGGPAFTKADGSYSLLGISSRADSWFKEMGEYGVNEVYTRVSHYREWIDEVKKENPWFIKAYTTQERFPQPGIKDQLYSICEKIGFRKDVQS